MKGASWKKTGVVSEMVFELGSIAKEEAGKLLSACVSTPAIPGRKKVAGDAPPPALTPPHPEDTTARMMTAQAPNHLHLKTKFTITVYAMRALASQGTKR